jgi:hypothetical protein
VAFFSILAVAALCRPATAADAPSKPAEKPPSPEERILKALGEPVKGKFVETPLSDVIDNLRTAHGIEIHFDRKALDDVGIGVDTPITKNIQGVSLRSFLRLLLHELSLTYEVYNEVLLITTPEEADGRMIVKVYDVADLVAPAPPDKAVEKYNPFAAPGDFETLIETITMCVNPIRWDGPSGAIAPFPAAGIRALAVRETQAVHEELETLLRNLRAMRHGKPPVEFFAQPLGKLTPAERDASRGLREKEDHRCAAVEAKLRNGLESRLSVELLATARKVRKRPPTKEELEALPPLPKPPAARGGMGGRP